MSTGNASVVVFDLWHTLIYGLSTDPIVTLWKSMAGDEEPCPSEFMEACLTTDIGDPDGFVTAMAARFDRKANRALKRSFRKLTATEREAIGLYPDTLKVLDELEGRGKRLVLASNLWPFPLPRVDEVLDLSRFEHLTYSFRVGVRKPAGALFADITRALAVPSSDCVMVGDSIGSDIVGGLAAGMEAVYICRSAQIGQVPDDVPERAGVVTSLSELLD